MFSRRGNPRTRLGWWCCAALFSLIGLSSCSKPPANPVRLAIPAIENLGGDVSDEWISQALPEVIASQLRASKTFRPVRVASRTEARFLGATQVIEGYYFRRGGRLVVNLVIEDIEKVRSVRSLSAKGPQVVAAADSISRQIDTAAQEFGTRSDTALRAFTEARFESDPELVIAAYQRCIKADPGFGGAYLAWAQWLAGRGDHTGAQVVIVMAKAREDKLSAVDRSELDVLGATISGDALAASTALSDLARKNPRDLSVWLRLARVERAARRFKESAAAFRKASEADPSQPLLWNALGYVEAYAGTFQGAVDAVRKYEKLAPAEVNPLDSLGDIHYYFGRFADAERFYLQAYAKSPQFLGGRTLYKAARSRLMTGDIAGATVVFSRFSKTQRSSGDPMAELREAQWKYLTGKTKDAMTSAERFAAATSMAEAAGQAYLQLSAWSLAAGDRGRARQFAARAAAAARFPEPKAFARICAFLSQSPASSAEWVARAGKEFGAPTEGRLRMLATVYALFLDKHAGAAIPVAKDLYESSDPAAPRQGAVLLAWALAGTGRVAEAAPLVEVFGFPQAGGESTFAFMDFPRIFTLRATVFEKQGKRNEAAQNLRIFKALSGS